MYFLSFLFCLVLAQTYACTTDLDCQLNGVCKAGTCGCDAPWTGPECGQLIYSPDSGGKTQDVRGKDLYPINDTNHNTWNGPIVGPVDDLYYMYLPLYPAGDLYHPTDVLLGTAPDYYGPWTYTPLKDVLVDINPGAMAYNDPKTDKPVYTLWLRTNLYSSASPAGPFTIIDSNLPKDCSINASPIYYKGLFYCTGSKGVAIWTTPELGQTWTNYANITKITGGEDPFLWVDTRDNWHMLYHAAGGGLTTNCGNGSVAQHYYSQDEGKTWTTQPDIHPYAPIIQWADGEQAYNTLERPHVYFDENGVMIYLTVAADLGRGGEGCAEKPNPCDPRGELRNNCPCSECKYMDHAGTVLIALGSEN